MSGEVNVIPTLKKFRGGASRSIFGGGQSRGGGQLKKTPCNLIVIYRHETHLFQAGLQARLLLRSTNLFKEEKCSFKENIFHLNIQSSQTYVPNVKTLIQTAK